MFAFHPHTDTICWCHVIWKLQNFPGKMLAVVFVFGLVLTQRLLYVHNTHEPEASAHIVIYYVKPLRFSVENTEKNALCEFAYKKHTLNLHTITVYWHVLCVRLLCHPATRPYVFLKCFKRSDGYVHSDKMDRSQDLPYIVGVSCTL